MYIGKLEFQLGPGRIYGLDISKRTAAVTVLHPDRQVEQYEVTLDKEGLEGFLQGLTPEDVVVFENTGNCWYLYQKMKPLVREVAIADARQVKLITSSNAKDDRGDSYKLAVLKATGFLPQVWMPDPATKGDREVVRHRMGVIKRRTQVKNQIRSLLLQHGVTIESSDVSTKDAELFLAQVASKLPDATQHCVASLLRELEFIEGELKVVDAKVATRAQRWKPMLGLLLTIPGMGLLLAFTVLAVVGDVQRFPKPGSLANYTGAIPEHQASAEQSWSGGVTKAGPAMLRWALAETVQQLVRRDGYFRNMYQRIKKGKKERHGIAVMACARELSETIWRMLTTGQPFEACVPRGRNTAPPSEALVQRRNQSRLRKEKREAAQLAAAHTTMSQQPPAIHVVRRNLDEVMNLATQAPVPRRSAEVNSHHTQTCQAVA